MKENIIYGIDLAKRKFHIVAVNSEGKKLSSKKVMREDLLNYFNTEPKGLIAMEACGSCHYWSQEFIKLGFEIKLLKTKDVQAYANIKQKNDFNDALAIVRAARDPELQSVQAKDKASQEVMLLHRLRSSTIRERVRKSNSLKSTLLEFGYEVKLSKSTFKKEAALEVNKAYEHGYISNVTKGLLLLEANKIKVLVDEENIIDKQIIDLNKDNAKARNLLSIPGIGPINANILTTFAMSSYETARDFAASLGLVPSQHTSGGKIQLGRITKQGSRYARSMLIHGARSIVLQAFKLKEPKGTLMKWIVSLLNRQKSFNKVCVAVANKLARIAYAVVVQNSVYAEK